MRDLKDPKAALASVGLTAPQVKALANGKGSARRRKKALRTLAEQVTRGAAVDAGQACSPPPSPPGLRPSRLRFWRVLALVATLLSGSVGTGDSEETQRYRQHHPKSFICWRPKPRARPRPAIVWAFALRSRGFAPCGDGRRLDAALRAADTGRAMSQENVEIVRRGMEYFKQTGDVLWDQIDREIEFTTTMCLTAMTFAGMLVG